MPDHKLYGETTQHRVINCMLFVQIWFFKKIYNTHVISSPKIGKIHDKFLKHNLSLQIIHFQCAIFKNTLLFIWKSTKFVTNCRKIIFPHGQNFLIECCLYICIVGLNLFPLATCSLNQKNESSPRLGAKCWDEFWSTNERRRRSAAYIII